MAQVFKTPDEMYAKRDATRKKARDYFEGFMTDPTFFDDEGSDTFSLNDFYDFLNDEMGEEIGDDYEGLYETFDEYLRPYGYSYYNLESTTSPAELGIGQHWSEFMEPGYYDRNPGAKYRLQQPKK